MLPKANEGVIEYTPENTGLTKADNIQCALDIITQNPIGLDVE